MKNKFFINTIQLILSCFFTILILYAFKDNIVDSILSNLSGKIPINIENIKTIINIVIIIGGIIMPILTILGNSVIIFLVVKFYEKNFKFEDIISIFCKVYLFLIPIKFSTFLASGNLTSIVNKFSLNSLFKLEGIIGNLLNCINLESLIFYSILYMVLSKKIKFKTSESATILISYIGLSIIPAAILM